MLPLPAAAHGMGNFGVRTPAIMRPFEPRSAVHRLYAGLPLQCQTTGVRFAHGAHRQLRAHMDRTFKRARKKGGGPPPSRAWLRSASDWLSRFGDEAEHVSQCPTSFFGDEEGTQETVERYNQLAADAAAVLRGTAVPAPAGLDLSELTCALSGEPLEAFYDPEADEWMVRDAQLLPDGRLCHVKSRPAPPPNPAKLTRRGSSELTRRASAEQR
mmetsp:Transcript_23214/g.58899  ORF Transcript_23214/g.58899 Transcript_23214/m.58899 type:complete len:214 (+) Transcript_23214:1869-2510(+)